MELKPCPKCQSGKVSIERRIVTTLARSFPAFTPKCSECLLTGPEFSAMQKAEEWWNTRHNPLESEVHELREALSNLVSFAKACNWDKSPTVRYTLIRCAEKALAKARGE